MFWKLKSLDSGHRQSMCVCALAKWRWNEKKALKSENKKRNSNKLSQLRITTLTTPNHKFIYLWFLFNIYLYSIVKDLNLECEESINYAFIWLDDDCSCLFFWRNLKATDKRASKRGEMLKLKGVLLYLSLMINVCSCVNNLQLHNIMWFFMLKRRRQKQHRRHYSYLSIQESFSHKFLEFPFCSTSHAVVEFGFWFHCYAIVNNE